MIYRRHLKSCSHRRQRRRYWQCQCPCWVDFWKGGIRIHKSLRTLEWEKAQQIVQGWEAVEAVGDQCPVAPPEPITLDLALQEFIADLNARHLNTSTIRKYKLLDKNMRKFANEEDLQFLKQFTVSKLSQFRNTWLLNPLSSGKTLERLRAFFTFCMERGWVDQNYARKLKAPKAPQRPTLPFEREEMLRILAALDPYIERVAPRGRDNARRLRSLILLLRWSGLRIGDAVNLKTEQIDGNRLRLYTQKSGVQVCSVLPEFVVTTLQTIPGVNDRFYFWSGVGNLEIAVSGWQKRIRKLMCLAGVKGHPHQFRDTFATELLQAGVPMERVSILLGHQSIRITEKYYAAWTDSRQRQIEADLRSAWERDPVIRLEAEVTRELRRKNEAVN
jgi:integrase/recombinase XerD